MQHLSRTVSPALPHPCLRALRAAFPQTIPVLAGYFVLGLGYGIYVQSLGLPVHDGYPEQAPDAPQCAQGDEGRGKCGDAAG